VTPDQFRKLALLIPGAVESSHMNHPDFRLGGKVFASLGTPDGDWAMVKLTAEQQREFMAKAPDAFKPCSGAWGRAGCTNVHLVSARSDVVRAALAAGGQNLESKRRPRRAADRPR
jgi:hypothetical protein